MYLAKRCRLIALGRYFGKSHVEAIMKLSIDALRRIPVYIEMSVVAMTRLAYVW